MEFDDVLTAYYGEADKTPCHVGVLAGLSEEERAMAVAERIVQLSQASHAHGCECGCEDGDCDCCELDDDDWEDDDFCDLDDDDCDWEDDDDCDCGCGCGHEESPEEQAKRRIDEVVNQSFSCAPVMHYRDLFEPELDENGATVLRADVAEAFQDNPIRKVWWEKAKSFAAGIYAQDGTLAGSLEDTAGLLGFDLSLIEVDDLSLVREVLDAGGQKTFSKEEIVEGVLSWSSFGLPYGALFYHNDEATAVIWEELRPLLAEIDFGQAIKLHAMHQQALGVFDALASVCGVVTPEDGFAQYCAWYGPDDYASADDLWSSAALCLDRASTGFEGLVLADEFMVECGPVAFNHQLIESLEYKGTGDGEVFAGQQEKMMNLLVSEIERLKACHARVGFAPLPEELKACEPYEWLCSSPEAQAVRAFLDAHVPEGEDDYLFADDYLFDLVSFWVDDVLPDRAAAVVMAERNVKYNEADMAELARLQTALYHVLPKWNFNGMSEDAAMERQTGRKVFRTQEGSLLKVGRNDPCPCGSGKKYKKCCGSGL